MHSQAVSHRATDGVVEQFRSQGYVKLKGVLPHEVVEQLRRMSSAAVETFGRSPNAYNVTQAADALWAAKEIAANGATQHDLNALARAIAESPLPRLLDEPAPEQVRGSFLLDTGVWRRVPELARFALASELPAIAASLLDAAAVRFYDDQLFIKEPGAIDRVAFHQDFPYFHLDAARGCVFWIPLDPVPEGSGRLGYIPGSHLWRKVFKPNIFASETPFPGSFGAEMPNIDADPETYGVQYIAAEPGDVLVHHFLTVHGSEGNRGASQRRAFSLRYCDSNVRYRFRPGSPPQPLHRANNDDGDELDPNIHPLVWPRQPANGAA